MFSDHFWHNRRSKAFAFWLMVLIFQTLLGVSQVPVLVRVSHLRTHDVLSDWLMVVRHGGSSLDLGHHERACNSNVEPLLSSWHSASTLDAIEARSIIMLKEVYQGPAF